MSKNALDVEHVTVRFRPYVDRTPTLRRSLATRRHKTSDPVVALEDVTFGVARGEAFGVIGHNGAGKSTLLRVMAGTLPPDEGKVVRRGRLSTLLSLGVGFVPELSGRRNVYLGGLASGLTIREVDEHFDDIVEYADLWDAIDRPLKTYSSGMYSRLAFAVGIFVDPEILLLDEILSVGDEEFRRKSMTSMRLLLERAGTIVFVSHGLEQVADFCDRVAWLDHGRVRMVGPSYEVVGRYRDEVEHRMYKTTTARKGGPWTVNQKVEAVLRIIAGADIGTIADEYGTSAQVVEKWRSNFVGAGKSELGKPTSGASQAN